MSLDDASIHAPAAGAATAERDAARFGRNAEAFVLLILLEGRSYGYEIRSRLAAFEFRRAREDPGMVYRLLRGLEGAGLITSEWDVAGSGPARRYYCLTQAGEAQLAHHARHLARQARRLQQFFERYQKLAQAIPTD